MRFAVLCCLMLITSAAVIGKPYPAKRRDSDTPCYGQTKGWRAWIERGVDEPELVVTGIVTTPTGGSWNVLTLGRTPWNDPPRQYISLEIRGMGYDIVTQAVVTKQVRGRFPLPPTFGGPAGRGLVIIECNGKEVGRAVATASDAQTL